MTGTLHEEQYTFLIISRSFLLRMRNVSDTFVAEIKTQNFVFCNFFFFEKRAFYETTWKKHCRAGQTRDDNMGHAHYMDSKGYK